jgi:hypothetical protein
MANIQAKKKKITLRLLLTVVVIGCVMALIVPWIYSQVKPGEMISVALEEAKGIRRGSPLLLWPQGIQYGEVDSISVETRFKKQQLVARVKLKDDARIVEAVKKAGNVFYVNNFSTANDYLKIYAPERLLTGSALVVVMGDPNTPKENFFDASNRRPPMNGIEWDSKKVKVEFQRDMHRLAAGATVVGDRGLVIGEVSSVEESNLGKVTVEITFIKSKEKMGYLNASTRYYLDSAEITASGLQGSGETFFFGPRIVACLDRSFEQVEEPVITFKGQSLPPPKYISQEGEGVLLLESLFSIAPDTPVLFEDRVIGYIASSEPGIDHSSFFLETRIYREFKHLVTEESKFSMEQKLKLKLFDRTPDGIFDSFRALKPEAIIPDPKALVRPGIVLFTPPTAKKTFAFSDTLESKQFKAYFLHKEPVDEWLKWRISIGSADDLVTLPYPVPIAVQAAWNNAVSWQQERIERNGIAVLIGDKLFGTSFSMVFPTDTKVAKNQVFKIIGRNTPFVGAPVQSGSYLVQREVNLPDLPNWPKEKVAFLSDPKDLYFVPNGSEPKLIDRRRLEKVTGGFRVKPEAILFDSSWDGLPVMTYQDENLLIGLLRFEDPSLPNSPVFVANILSE